MYTDFFAVPHVSLPVRRVSRPPLRRMLAFIAIVFLCLAVDVLILFALYRAGSALLAEFKPWTLAQIVLASTVLLYVAYRLFRTTRSRAAAVRARSTASQSARSDVRPAAGAASGETPTPTAPGERARRARDAVT